MTYDPWNSEQDRTDAQLCTACLLISIAKHCARCYYVSAFTFPNCGLS